MTAQEHKPHSAEYFVDSRDYWWNADFIALMAKRWDVSGVNEVLDVGSGLGHWGRVLSPHLPADAKIIGMDREPKWVARATETARERGLAGRHEYVQGSAEQLPFADASFDLVTCQTVLIHTKDPKHVLTEMLRVLRPGGLLITAEPNNIANSLVGDSVLDGWPVDDVIARTRFYLRCERGKVALGEGDISLGGALPNLFREIGVESVDVHLNDKAPKILPPYADPEQRALVAEMLEHDGSEFWMWPRHDTHRYFLANGGSEAEFEELWAMAGRYMHAVAEQIRAGTYAFPGGQITYLVWGRKRRP